MAEINISSGSGARRRRRRFKYLPEELQEKILLRLPIKSLMRFESVCKSWLFLFRSHRFIDLHGQHGCHPNSPWELHTTSSVDLREMVPGLSDTYKTSAEKRWGLVYFVMGPLNGIYCITAHSRESSSKRYAILTGKIALCNPATHDYKITNPFPRRFHSRLSHISSKPCLLRFGFGFVNVQKSNSLDYRVVVFIHYGGMQNPSFLVFVYSVQRGEWMKIVDYEPGKRNVGKRKATEAFNVQGRRIIHIYNPLEGCPQRFFKGCYYWMTICEDHTWYVLSFNFADRSFKLIGGPPCYRDYVAAEDEEVVLVGDVFVLHDHLAVIHLFSVPSNNGKEARTVEIRIWMMMEYGVEQSWTKIYTIHPNLYGVIHNLYGIHYQTLISGSICIERLFFKVGLNQIVSCDGSGYEVDQAWDPHFNVCWNTPGISTYIQTLEHL